MSAAGGHDRSKVPDVTLVFWVVKIAATTLGDTLTMTMRLGYLLGSAIVLVVFMVVVCAQITARQFHRWLYWLAVVGSEGRCCVDRVGQSFTRPSDRVRRRQWRLA